MAEDVDTGMEKGDMMAALKFSKKEPVNFAFGMSKDSARALLMLDRHRPGKKIESGLYEKFADAKNTRWGHAEVDPDVDPKLVKFFVNKPCSSMEKRLIKTLKGTGFSKVEIVLDEESENADP